MSLFYNFLKRIVLTLFFVGIATNAMARVCFLPGIENCDGYTPGYNVNPDISCASLDGFDTDTACKDGMPQSQTCTSNNGCYYRICQYNSKAACEKDKKSDANCMEDTDTGCFFSELKTCKDLGYKTESEANELKSTKYICEHKVKGKDSECYSCRKKKCTDYEPNLVDYCETSKYSCTKTSYTDADGKECYRREAKSCAQIGTDNKAAYVPKGSCSASEHEIDVATSIKDGACVICAKNSYEITVIDKPNYTYTDNYGYDIRINRTVVSTSSSSVDANSTGYLSQNGEGKQTISVANGGNWRVYRNNDENGNATSSQTVDWGNMIVKVNGTAASGNIPALSNSNNPLKACEPATVNASDGTYTVKCQYGDNVDENGNDSDKPTCEKINSDYKSSGDCASGTKVYAGISDADGNKCFYCRPDNDDNGDICIKLNYVCNGSTCQGTDFDKFMELVKDGGLEVYGANGGKKYDLKLEKFSYNDNGEYCISPEQFDEWVNTTLANETDEVRIKNIKNEEYNVFNIKFNLDYDAAAKKDDYFKNLKDDEKIIFKNTDNKSTDYAFYRLYMQRYNNKYYYLYEVLESSYISPWSRPSGEKSSNGYYYNTKCRSDVSYDNSLTYDQNVDRYHTCLVNDYGFEEITSPIVVNINLDNSKPKCVYFTATCPDIENNSRWNEDSTRPEKEYWAKIGYCLNSMELTIGNDDLRIKYAKEDDSQGVDSVTSYLYFKFTELKRLTETKYEDETDRTEGFLDTNDGYKFKFCQHKDGKRIGTNEQVTLVVGSNTETDDAGLGGYVFDPNNSTDGECNKNNAGVDNLCDTKTYVYNPGSKTNTHSAIFIPFNKIDVSCVAKKDWEGNYDAVWSVCSAVVKSNRTSSLYFDVDLDCYMEIEDACKNGCTPKNSGSQQCEIDSKETTCNDSVDTDHGCHPYYPASYSCSIEHSCKVTGVSGIDSGRDDEGYYNIIKY